MSLFDDASLVYIPTGYKPTKNYSGKPSTGGADMTFSRASGATRVNSRGLVEKVRTNLILQSNTFDTTWTATSATLTSGQTGYDGTSDAWLLEATATSSSLRQNYSAPGVFCFSAYAKAGSTDWIRLRFDNTSTADVNVWFNLSDGSIGASNGIAPYTENIGDGWWRLVVQANTSDLNNLRILTAASDGANPALGDYVYIQDAQLEQGLVATNYIETTSAAVSVGPVNDEPRLTYDPVNPTAPSLLMEPQRTNLVQYSESFNTSSSWSLSRTSAFGSGSVANAVTSPDGYTNAEYIQQATGETDGGGCFQGISYTSGASYTLSVFAKQGENRYARIGFGIGSGGAGIFCGFDLQDGIAGTPGTGITAKIENYGNGWYRCSVTATAQITGARNTFAYQSSNLNTFVTTPLQGIYVWGAQLEESYYETSYIPTLDAAVTRLADASFKTGIGSLLSASEYTLYWEGTHIPTGQYNSFMTIYKASDLNSSARFYRNNTNNEIRAAIFDSVSGLSLDLGSGVTTQTAKCALRVKAGDYALYVNGNLVNSNTNALAPSSNLDAVNLQYFDSSQSFDQKTGQVLFFKTALSNATLATLTSL